MATLHHACLACGASCEGVRVRVMPSERARVLEVAQAAGVADPFDGDALRRVAGRCAFLRDDRRCALHAHGGAAAKPAACRQYPLVVVRTEQGDRAGIDPGCYTHRASWEGPGTIDASAATQIVEVRFEPAEAALEAAVLARLDRAERTGDATAALLPPSAPAGFEARFMARARAGELARQLDSAETAAAQRAVLAPILAATAPPGALDAADDAFALDVASRVVSLRLLPTVPAPEAALLVLGGASMAATVGRPGAVGPVLAAWTRGLRTREFLAAARAAINLSLFVHPSSPGRG